MTHSTSTVSQFTHEKQHKQQ